MADGLERDTDVVASNGTQTKSTTTITTTGGGAGSTSSETVTDALTGVLLSTVATVDANGNLQTSITNAGANALIIVDGATGTVASGNATLATVPVPIACRVGESSIVMTRTPSTSLASIN